MTDDLVKAGGPWNPHAELTRLREEDPSLAELVEGKIRAGYLRGIRTSLERPGRAQDLAVAAERAPDALDDVAEALSGLAKEGSEDVFRAAVEQVLGEFELQRGSPAALWLVNDETGELIGPVGDGDVFRPPDFVDQGGVLRPGRMTVHPSITAKIGIEAAKAARMTKVLAKAASDPIRGASVSHLVNPEGMVEAARKRLEASGVAFADLPEAEEETVEFGSESSEGSHQSVNPAFNRSAMFAGVLAQKVLKLCGPGGRVQFGELRPMEGARRRWYEVDVRYVPSD